MAEGYKIRDQEACYFITFAVVEWVDVFTRKEYVDIVIESLRYCQKEKDLLIHAWCIMSNHLHLIVSVKEGGNLSDVLRDFKKFTSKEILKAIENNKQESRRNWMLWIFKSAGTKNSRNEKYQFWQQDNHPIELSNAEITKSKLNYLHDNPVNAGIVRNAEDYVLSSSSDYYGTEKGAIELSLI